MGAGLGGQLCAYAADCWLAYSGMFCGCGRGGGWGVARCGGQGKLHGSSRGSWIGLGGFLCLIHVGLA